MEPVTAATPDRAALVSPSTGCAFAPIADVGSPSDRENAPPTASAVTDLPLGELEDRLTGLATRIAVAECEFLDLLGEFDARDGWGASGLRSSAHWLSWRVGMSLGTARDKVRVARALRRLPHLRSAFATGSLSYCKVRALSRVATASTELELVEVARGATGAQTETLVRSWRQVLLGRSAAAAHVRRGTRRRVEDDGSVVYTVRVSPEEAPAVDSALMLARRVVIDEDEKVVQTPEETALVEELVGEPPFVRSQADAFMVMVESFLASGPKGEAGDPYLVMVHADLDALTAACRGGSGPDTGAACGNASAETPAELAGTTTHLVPPASGGPAVDPVPDGGSLHQVSLARRPATCTTEDGLQVSASTVMRMLCASPAQLVARARDGRPLDLGRTSRNADRRQRRALRVRDGGRCRFPGCTQRHRLIPHHSSWWSRGGRTDLDLLVSVCPVHHRAVHELGYDVRALGDGHFAWFRPDGQRIADAPRPGELPMESGAATEDARPVSPVEPTAIVPTWGGERIDLHHLLGGMAANLITATGRRLADIPDSQLDELLRQAAGRPAAA